MDKELIRVIIIFVGLVVIAGMIVWGMVSNRRAERKPYPDDKYGDKYSDKYDDDDVDVVPLGSALDDGPLDGGQPYAKAGYDDDAYLEDDDAAAYAYAPATDTTPVAAKTGWQTPNAFTGAAAKPAVPAPKPPPTPAPEPESSGVPEIVQFGIVSKEQQGFNGMQLAVAFRSAGLVYGGMKIFEARDDVGDTVYSVASIVEPGTFPETGLDQFHCPGIVLFMQPEFLADPVAVFDQLVATVHKLAKQLDGVEWDQKHKPLTEAAIASLRERLF